MSGISLFILLSLVCLIIIVVSSYLRLYLILKFKVKTIIILSIIEFIAVEIFLCFYCFKDNIIVFH